MEASRAPVEAEQQLGKLYCPLGHCAEFTDSGKGDFSFGRGCSLNDHVQSRNANRTLSELIP